VLDTEATEFAEYIRQRAFKVFRDYLTLAAAIQARTISQIAAHLDDGPYNNACNRLEENGGSAVAT
jgi:hypothetical protein